MIDGYQFNKAHIGVAAVMIHPCETFERKLKVTIPAGFYAVLVQENGNVSYYHNTSSVDKEVGFSKQYFPEIKLPLFSFLPFVCKEIKAKLFIVRDKIEVKGDVYSYEIECNGKKAKYKGLFSCVATVEDPLMAIEYFYDGKYIYKKFYDEYKFSSNYVNTFQNIRTLAVYEAVKRCIKDGLTADNQAEKENFDMECLTYCAGVLFPKYLGMKLGRTVFDVKEFTYL